MAVYTTSVDIANRALQLLGARMITTLADNSRNAVQMNFLYDKVRVAELQAHVWNFATTFKPGITLAGTVTYPNGVIRNKFALPTDFIRFADQNPRNSGVYRQNTAGGIKFSDFSIEAGFIVTATAAPLTLRYVKDFSTVASMTPLFCEAVAAAMAHGACETITQNPTKRQLAQAEYDRAVERAQLINLIESGNDEPLEDALKTGRVSVKPSGVQPLPVRAVR